MVKINVVLEGRHKGSGICMHKNYLEISTKLNKDYISSYTIIDETNKGQYSLWKGALGVATDFYSYTPAIFTSVTSLTPTIYRF